MKYTFLWWLHYILECASQALITSPSHPPFPHAPAHSGTEDSRESLIYRKILGPDATSVLDTILQPLSLAVQTGSMHMQGVEGLEEKVAQLIIMACEVSDEAVVQ